MTTVAINNLWNYLNGLALTSSEATWLSEKLRFKADSLKKESENEETTKKRKIQEKFKNLTISPDIKKFRGIVKLDEMDLDDKTRYIISK